MLSAFADSTRAIITSFRIKEQSHPKFYWFDPGVARSVSGRLRIPCEREERGHLLETFMLNELRAYNDYEQLGGALSYWRTPAGTEVDFVWSRGREHVAIEVKSASVWKRECATGLGALGEAIPLKARIGVYLGTERLAHDGVQVLPLGAFFDELYGGRLLG